jgi:hypothetical protein
MCRILVVLSAVAGMALAGCKSSDPPPVRGWPPRPPAPPTGPRVPGQGRPEAAPSAARSAGVPCAVA